MREALRSALLSVLFFALLIGGAPSMAAAIHTYGGTTDGSGGEKDSNKPRNTYVNPGYHGPGVSRCDNYVDMMATGVVGGAVGLGATLFPEPFSTAVGIPATGIGAVTGFIGGVGWLWHCSGGRG